MIEHLPKTDYEKAQEEGKTVTYCTIRQIVKHTIGLDVKRPKNIDGCKVYVPYRNYFNTYVGSYPWDELEEAGYAAHGAVNENGMGMMKATTDYYLTRKGLDWVGKELGIIIVEKP